MKIAFIVSYLKTIFFYPVAQKLTKNGYEIYWIAPSHWWANWLYGQGVRKDHVLDITIYGQEWVAKSRSGLNSSELQALMELEQTNGCSVKNVILMDRLLRLKPYPYALAYVHTCQHRIKNFFQENEVKAVFSEQTWTIELVATLVCRQIGIPMWAPTTVRIPDGRFAFFEGYLQNRIVPVREVTNQDRKEAQDFLKGFRDHRPKPSYFHQNNEIPNPKLNWFKKFMYHLYLSRADRFNETRPSLVYLISTRIGEVWNSQRALGRNFFGRPEIPPQKPFVLITLHKQPESSVDVLGSHYSNQLETIEVLARSLPATHELWVKEHSNALGDRGASFYCAVSKLPGVRLVDPFINSFDYIQYADLTISISGTACYEAALMGRKALTLVPMYFSDILVADSFCPSNADAFQTMRYLLSDKAVSVGDDKIVDFLAFVYANSFPGLIEDPVSNPASGNSDNVISVAKAIKQLLM
jgi:hypothetical protein